MKIPSKIDLDKFGAKDFVNNAIKHYGKSRDVNELALTIYCQDENGSKFEIVQFHNNRRIAHFLPA